MPASERFVRWQATTIAQFGFVNNLVVALATGALAFALNEFKGVTSAATNRPTLCLATLVLVASVVCGLGCAVNRLLDFRGTAEIARDKMGEEEKALAREHVAGLGMASWRLLYGQLATFGFGAILLIWSVARQTWN